MPRRTDEDRVARGTRDKLDRLDSYQQRHPALGVLIAVVRKFVEDESINLAAGIAFWAFFAVFPLLLVFVTLLGYFLPPSLQGEVLRSAAGFVPLLSTDSIGHLSGQWWAFAVGIVSALWSGSFVVTATQSGLNSVWEIPFAQRSGFGAQMGRSLVALGAVGLGLVGSTVISNYVTGTDLGVVGRLAGYLIAVALDAVLGRGIQLMRRVRHSDEEPG